MVDPAVTFLQIVFGLLVFALVGIVWITVYQLTKPSLKKFNKGVLHKKKKKKTGVKTF